MAKKDRKHIAKKEKNKKKQKNQIKTLDKNLKYIGLDLENIPDFLKKQEKTKFELNSLAKDKSSSVFIYLDIKKLEFLITDKSSDSDLFEKYKNSKSISEFLKKDSKEEKDKKNLNELIKIIENVDINELKRIEKTQKILNEKIPDTIKYFKSNMWNIYYSEIEKKYFMLISLEDLDHSEFIYALKKKIETIKKDEEYKIYVPINYLEQSEEYLKLSEKMEIENILWYFTRNWTLTYDTYDKSGKYNLNFVGDILLRDRIKGRYLIKINQKEDALKLYKFLKAIYTLEKETNKFASFKIFLNENSGIKIIYNDKEINYEDIPEILLELYTEIYKKYKWYEEKIQERAEEHLKLKKVMEEKEKRYQKYQYEIVKYLNIKDSFFGRFKYFFQNSLLSKRVLKTKKRDEIGIITLDQKEKKKLQNKLNEEIENEIKKVDSSLNKEDFLKQKELKNVTIEDVTKIYKIYIKLYEKTKNLVNDINAAKLFLINIDRKIENAVKYLEEIEFSKRSIFSFWKFTNKDNVKALKESDEIKMPHEKTKEERQVKELEEKKEKLFNFDMDFETFAEEKDQINRKKLSKDEINAAFVTYNILDGLNIIHKNEEEKDKEELEKKLKLLKQNFKNQENYIGEEYNIFGQNEKAENVRYMKDKSFREKDRNIFKAINFNKNITVEEYIEILKNIDKNLQSALKKINTDQKISLYFIEDNINYDLNKNKEYKIVNLDVQDELKKYKDNKKELKLIKLNIKSGIGIIYLTNIIFYNNENNTLPEGMENSRSAIINLEKIKLKEIKTEELYLNNYFDKEYNINKEVPYDMYEKIVSENNIKKVKIIEYDI